MLVEGRSRTRIPVACVEQGRWEYENRRFTSGTCCPPTLRHFLKQMANAAGDISGRLDGQLSLWQAIRRKHVRLGVRSSTGNPSDVLERHGDSVEDLRGRLPYVEGSSGIAVEIGGKSVLLDLFDKPTTLRKLWDRLVQGIMIDALEICTIKCRTSGTAGSVKLYKKMTWRRVETVGLGEAYRGQDDDGTLGNALVVDGMLLHLNMSTPR